MTELEKFQNILSTKEARLIKVTNKLNEIGMGNVDQKLADKRIKFSKESSDLQWMISELKKIIKDESK